MWDSSSFLNALTPKFYVALTGTSSLISGMILIFEWWYFRKYGSSFIERMSMTHLAPWIGGVNGGGGGGVNEAASECKVWRNPLSLLRGAEYARACGPGGVTGAGAPLTYYDMNLTAQEHQAWFIVGGSAAAAAAAADGEAATGAAAAEACMARAWREREAGVRVQAARTALSHYPHCAPALLLLAEEEAPTVLEAERILRRALRCAETAWRASAAAAAAAGSGAGGGEGGAAAERARRDAAVLAHVKRRLAMCARRLGRLRDATRLFRELARDAPPSLHALALHENLIEVLLEQKAYADVQAVLARYDDISLPKSATICYTAALLRARTLTLALAALPTGGAGVGAAAGAGAGGGGAVMGPGGCGAAAAVRAADAAAAEAMRRAIEFNPHVPDYLLELRPLTMPPEHVLKRGDSEAVSYAFFHARHWRACPGALRVASQAVRGGRPPPPSLFHPYPACTACADRELLPPQHSVSVFPPRRAPALLAAAAALCAGTAALALAAHRWPETCAAALSAALAALRELHPVKLLHLFGPCI